MAKRHVNHVAWGLAALLGGIVLLGVAVQARWRAYWVAKHRGKGADLHGDFLIFAPLRGADLERANLENANLTGADLAGANLWYANLPHANLAGANLVHAHLGFTNLRAADLTGARLQDADIIDEISGAHLSGADLRRATLWAGDARGVNLSRADLRHASLYALDLRGANLRHANLANACMTNIDNDLTHGGCLLQGADLTGAVLTQLIYDPNVRWPGGFDPSRHGARVLGPEVDLRGWDLDGAVLVEHNLDGANLQDASLRGAHLNYAKLRHANLRGAILRDAELIADPRDADLRGADVTGAVVWYGPVSKWQNARYDATTRWPAGFDPVKAGAIKVGG